MCDTSLLLKGIIMGASLSEVLLCCAVGGITGERFVFGFNIAGAVVVSGIDCNVSSFVIDFVAWLNISANCFKVFRCVGPKFKFGNDGLGCFNAWMSSLAAMVAALVELTVGILQ